MAQAPQINDVKYDTTAPVVDREHIDMLLGAEGEEDSGALAHELYELYVTDGMEKLGNLERICRERDSAELRKLLHFIAGSAGNLGLMRMSLFCRGIEKAIHEGVLDDYEACAKLLPQEFDMSCQGFAHFLDSQ